jgi:hypothetical protein
VRLGTFSTTLCVLRGESFFVARRTLNERRYLELMETFPHFLRVKLRRTLGLLETAGCKKRGVLSSLHISLSARLHLLDLRETSPMSLHIGYFSHLEGRSLPIVLLSLLPTPRIARYSLTCHSARLAAQIVTRKITCIGHLHSQI